MVFSLNHYEMILTDFFLNHYIIFLQIIYAWVESQVRGSNRHDCSAIIKVRLGLNLSNKKCHLIMWHDINIKYLTNTSVRLGKCLVGMFVYVHYDGIVIYFTST